ncbi:MAG: OmpA family protein [Opitutaceae bacterium]|nr:OmpA family protein [Opitutaceae bacterium]
MNLFVKKTTFILLSAFVVLSGCRKKPQRPDPSATVMGQQGGGLGAGDVGNLGATDASAMGLQNREGVIETEDKIIGLLKPVYFDFDKSGINAAERTKLQAAKDYLDQTPQHRLLIEGHCDWRGTAEYNLGLGDRRANAAREYLLSLGVAANRIETLSKGSLDAKENGSDTEMAQDRRAELIVLKK